MRPEYPQYPSPVPQGLYDPRCEHDACGVGMYCNIRGKKSHSVVRNALRILVNLSHRGAAGCDESTGDGAGILIQMPHNFLQKTCDGFALPEAGRYGCGLVFLPKDDRQRRWCMRRFESVIWEAGQIVLGWRKVPVRNDALGDLARTAEPEIRQIFVGRNSETGNGRNFERTLFIIRKHAEKTVRDSDLPDKADFHVPSLSCRTLVYKGMFLARQLAPYFPDLTDPAMTSALALVHQRYSTNTFPEWRLAQPFRYLCHNGEINTLRGNINRMNARQHMFGPDRLGPDISKLLPIATPGGSDSAILDNVTELLCHTGRSLPHAMMMLIPEAWQNHETMSDTRKAFYRYHACLMEPWDGPAAVFFTDGILAGAVLDRNGLRPARYTVTGDGFLIMASETGVLPVDPARVTHKGRLEPGRMFLVDTARGRIIDDDEIKNEVSQRKPYRRWLDRNLLRVDDLPEPAHVPETGLTTLLTRQQVFGYTEEDLRIILEPMGAEGKEATGSMGDDIPLAILSGRPRLLCDYFRQLFAQVTNPPLDPIREALVTSLTTTIGAEKTLFEESAEHCRQLELASPVLTNHQLARIRGAQLRGIRSRTFPICYPATAGERGLREETDRLREAAARAVRDGTEILILSDRGAGRDHLPIPALLATGAVHHHLIREGLRTRCGLISETGEAREVHHFCCLLGYGANAVNPYLAYESLRGMAENGMLKGTDPETAVQNFIRAIDTGILKVMAKMGISTLQSYCGAQIFECIGLSKAVVRTCFTGTVSRLGGAGLKVIDQETRMRHEQAFPAVRIPGSEGLDPGGKYQWRRGGEAHQYGPEMIARLQQAVRTGDQPAWDAYTGIVNRQSREEGFIRGLMAFRTDAVPVPLDEVEPWTDIVRRFKTGAISYGSISKEAHETLAIAMNRIGSRSNSGEGGEDPDRFLPDPGGDWRNSAIKQVASGRFGVTSHYLANATDLQIKMAQGAKPGEGGQLPAFKVYPWIAETRHATPWVGLISPPPHHDIYSIEDLAQLIHDLKNANPSARINVKLVSEVGVGTVAAGVAKGKADLILISGASGGTGASPQTAIRYGGLPWELGLAETHQTLVLNGLRSRIRVECDGQMKTGRDIAVACLLGAEEFGFGTVALVALGCIMMRVCHLNTCPVGIATQDPELRKKFTGKPAHVIRLMRFLAEDFRQIMARLGFRRVDEMVGRTDRLEAVIPEQWKARRLDLSEILHRPAPPELGPACQVTFQDHGIEKVLDNELIRQAGPALEMRKKVKMNLILRNVHRTVGTLLSYEISRRYGGDGLPDDTITVRAEGSAGQSFCAFGARGLTFHVRGDANDYFGKGLSGAKLTIRPPDGAAFAPEENIIIGNVAFYGATAGEACISGRAGERFCVRNSGVRAVAEGVGDHGCEYMTGGCVVILGPVGRNFAAGMSGGVAYVLDTSGEFARHRCNTEMVALEAVRDADDIRTLREMIERHRVYTESRVACRILDNWSATLPEFVKVMPVDYKKALERMARNGSER
ncbi:glutamate synthase subunit alpha [Desulfonema ishimotonii]|uniref:Glutamate synthase [NADPH] large chain n=1 Tax=Desulfonema ishimotonii TaxID=45657 RepID=A0A401FUS7_9BACT|nr:glutamate synthase large subunit [Desulfonema ishimotonii]GBC60737.1 glutamate synthase subunit alpha [Desulfonema ishimotonii]